MLKGDYIKDKITGEEGHICKIFPFMDETPGREPILITIETARSDAVKIRAADFTPGLDKEWFLRVADEYDRLLEGQACQVWLKETGLAYRNFDDLELIHRHFDNVV